MLAPSESVYQYCTIDVIFTLTSQERVVCAAAATAGAASVAKCLAINN